MPFAFRSQICRIRPVWHQREDRVLEHILVCFLSFVLWRTLGEQCKRAGLGDEHEEYCRNLHRLRLVDVRPAHDIGTDLRTRCITRPSEHQRILLERLAYACQLELSRQKCSGKFFNPSTNSLISASSWGTWASLRNKGALTDMGAISTYSICRHPKN